MPYRVDGLVRVVRWLRLPSLGASSLLAPPFRVSDVTRRRTQAPERSGGNARDTRRRPAYMPIRLSCLCTGLGAAGGVGGVWVRVCRRCRCCCAWRLSSVRREEKVLKDAGFSARDRPLAVSTQALPWGTSDWRGRLQLPTFFAGRLKLELTIVRTTGELYGGRAVWRRSVARSLVRSGL